MLVTSVLQSEGGVGAKTSGEIQALGMPVGYSKAKLVVESANMQYIPYFNKPLIFAPCFFVKVNGEN